MKKLVIFSFFTIFLFSFYSCEKPQVTTTTTTVTKVTTTEPGSNGFLFSRQLVVKGNTVWGFSREVYGSGIQWRDIVALNPFLQEPGRVYWNNFKQKWIVKIYPGEVVRIGNDVVTPSVTVEETTTTVERTDSPVFIIPWYVWILIAAIVIILIINLINYQRNILTAKIHSSVNVNMRNCDIDTATETSLLAQKQTLWSSALSSIVNKDSLSCISFHMDSDNFDLDACFCDKKTVDRKRPENKKDEKK